MMRGSARLVCAPLRQSRWAELGGANRICCRSPAGLQYQAAADTRFSRHCNLRSETSGSRLAGHHRRRLDLDLGAVLHQRHHLHQRHGREVPAQHAAIGGADVAQPRRRIPACW